MSTSHRVNPDGFDPDAPAPEWATRDASPEEVLRRQGMIPTTTQAQSLYDDPTLAPQQIEFNNVTFDNPGDQVHARIMGMEVIDTRFGRVPKYYLMDLDTEQERTMLAGAYDLWEQLHKLRPDVGDVVHIYFIRFDGRRKLFNVTVESSMKSA